MSLATKRIPEEIPDDGYPWDVYFDIMEDVAKRRAIPLVKGCQIAKKNQLEGTKAFLDQMHPTGALNQAYAQAIVQILEEKRWPRSTLIPKRNVPPYTRTWDDTWPSVYPEPKDNSGIIRPDNMDFHIQS